MAKKRNLAEILANIRVARLKLKQRINMLEKRVKDYEILSMKDFNKYSILSIEILKETEQLENLKKKLEVMDVLLEMLEIKVETAIQVGLITSSLKGVLEAIKEFQRVNPILPPELSILVSDISDFSVGLSVDIIEPQRDQIQPSIDAKSIIREAEKIAEERQMS